MSVYSLTKRPLIGSLCVRFCTYCDFDTMYHIIYLELHMSVQMNGVLLPLTLLGNFILVNDIQNKNIAEFKIVRLNNEDNGVRRTQTTSDILLCHNAKIL